MTSLGEGRHGGVRAYYVARNYVIKQDVKSTSQNSRRGLPR